MQLTIQVKWFELNSSQQKMLQMSLRQVDKVYRQSKQAQINEKDKDFQNQQKYSNNFKQSKQFNLIYLKLKIYDDVDAGKFTTLFTIHSQFISLIHLLIQKREQQIYAVRANMHNLLTEPANQQVDNINRAHRQLLKTQFNSSIYINEAKKKQIQDALKSTLSRFKMTNQKQQAKEQWQAKNIEIVENTFSQIIQLQKVWSYLYASLVLMFQVGFIWFISASRLLQYATNQITIYVFSLALFVFSSDTLVRLYLRTTYQNILVQRKILFAFKAEIYLLFYCAFNIIIYHAQLENSHAFLYYFLDILGVITVYKRSKIIWQHIKIISYTTQHKYRFKLIDLLATLIIFGHIFALLLYLSSFFDQQNSWISRVNEKQISNFSRYFYAFYFSCTTMLTIGFGDLVPLNKVQILAVLIVQILGAVTLSFIINQLGFTMGLMRKQEEQLEKNLSTLSKMSKFYHIQQNFIKSIKQNLLNNRKSESTVYPQDQKNVLIKLNEDLRQKMIIQSSANVVKSCSFFICHWTQHFQNLIAKKLIKKILHPNELINQISGKQKIYIVKHGKIQLYTNSNTNYKQNLKKLMKVINVDASQQVTDNVYGYTSVISSKTIKLSAISKNFTSVFFVEKDCFISCVNSNKLDYQYYFQIKDKIDRAKCPQAFQAPTTNNHSQHFKPNEYCIIKRHLAMENQKSNPRKQHCRMLRRTRLMTKAKLDIDLQRIITPRFTIGSSCQLPLSKLGQQKTQSVQNTNKIQGKIDEQMPIFQFECIKEYTKYYKKNNLSKVLKKFQVSFCPIKAKNKSLDTVRKIITYKNLQK